MIESAELAASRDGVIDALRAVVSEQDLLVGEAVRARSPAWGRPEPCAALALVRPRSTEQLAAVMRVCHEHGQPVVTHGGVTGLVRGAIAETDEIVVSTERLDSIEEVDPQSRTMRVQSGVTLERIQQEAHRHGLEFPLDLGARAQCTIGGNISTNAGGNHVIRYGMTRAQVLGIEAVLADGTIVQDLSKMLKNNAGYDLKQLFIGSEGTLGIVTRAVLRLRTRPLSRATAFAAVPSFEALLALLAASLRELGDNLTAFEVMWESFYRTVTAPETQNRPPLAYGSPYYVLMEVAGTRPRADEEHFAETVEKFSDQELIGESVVALSPPDRRRLWAMRDAVEELNRLGPIYTFDVSLPIPEMKSYVAEVEAALDDRFEEHQCVVFGHLGDGNLHLVITVGRTSSDIRRWVEESVYEPLRSRHGSVSAEHGVGLEKQPYLSYTRGPAEINLMRVIKHALDPKNLLNPGRVVPPE